jgi:hypothetical protein
MVVECNDYVGGMLSGVVGVEEVKSARWSAMTVAVVAAQNIPGAEGSAGGALATMATECFGSKWAGSEKAKNPKPATGFRLLF